MESAKTKIEFVIGTNFSSEQLENFLFLNENFKDSTVYSVYGSLKKDQIDLPSARPDYRLPAINKKTFEKYLEQLKENGIRFEYAVNGTLDLSAPDFFKKSKEYIITLKYLKEIGVDQLIISNPLFMKLASDTVDIPIKVSTIMGVNNSNSISYYKDLNVNAICLDIYKNHNLPFLKNFCKTGIDNNIETELLVNEVCMFGDAPCSNFMRQACYANSTLGGNEEQVLDNWPFGICQKKREENPICWLKTTAILPQHIDTYFKLTGIKRYKISGRTNEKAYVKNIVRSFFEKKYTGGIKDFFSLPQNNLSSGSFNPTVSLLEDTGLYKNWLSLDCACDYDCERCGKCNTIYEKIQRN